MKKEIKFTNETLENIKESARIVFESKVMEVQFNDVWYNTIIDLCEQAKMINEVESLSDILIDSISEPSDKYVVGHNRK